ncbi:hypothetical protein [Cupriavidus metallidurans]|jgi:hypothetical protein|nr:hypothetical protein [Cupriavidus metallidurans]MDE4918405.1 hypothetical protein [Cupriavidus metallidurans]
MLDATCKPSCLPNHPAGPPCDENQPQVQTGEPKKNGRNAHHSPILAEDDTFE